MEWTVQELAQRAGISGRTLRHYHQIGLLEPDRIGSNGYRYYGSTAVARLQRILLLRDLGMSLPSIAELLDAATSVDDEISALEDHLTQLRAEQASLTKRIRAVEHTVAMRREGREPRMDLMLDGFNDRYQEEVVRRWGQAAFDASNSWWHSKTVGQQHAWQQRAEELVARWRELAAQGEHPGSEVAQEHAATHVAWFADIPGTPTHAGDAEGSAQMIRGMAEMYRTHPDFLASFGTKQAAQLAADALQLQADQIQA